MKHHIPDPHHYSLMIADFHNTILYVISEPIGLGSKSLSAAERGVVGVSLTTLLKMCHVLSISSDQLLFESSVENDVSSITHQLERLTPEQFEIAQRVFNNLMKVFAISGDGFKTF